MVTDRAAESGQGQKVESDNVEQIQNPWDKHITCQIRKPNQAQAWRQCEPLLMKCRCNTRTHVKGTREHIYIYICLQPVNVTTWGTSDTPAEVRHAVARVWSNTSVTHDTRARVACLQTRSEVRDTKRKWERTRKFWLQLPWFIYSQFLDYFLCSSRFILVILLTRSCNTLSPALRIPRPRWILQDVKCSPI